METKRNGRPSKYKPEFDKLAFKFCLLGAKDEDLAKLFDTTVTTINNWKNDHPSFLDSLKAGRDEADSQVAKSLYHRALGYEHKDTDIRVIAGKVVKTEIIKHYPPDTTAMIFWLKNRQRARWRDRQDTDLTVNLSDDFKRALKKASNIEDDVDQD